MALYSALDDTRLRQRLIDASAPALEGCVASAATCTDAYGATWTFSITTPDATCNTGTTGCRIRVTAAGRLPLLTEFLTNLLVVNRIQLQGDASMVIF